MNVVAYIRVSTKGQGESGLGLEAQRSYIDTAAKQNGWTVVAEFSETISGTTPPLERPECSKAIAQGLPLVVAKLDRLSRDVEHIASLMKRVDFKVATMPQADKFQLHLFAALAEQERAFISQRTKDALKALQERADSGCEESLAKVERRSQALSKGRAKGNADNMNAIKAEKIDAHREGIAPHVMACLYQGCNTLQSLADCLNSKGKHTSRGGLWTPTTVRRLMLSLNVSFKK
ncbi:recombinase family protein [Pseudomonas syringae group genomosp. 3]|uniref:Resolvase-like protein n=1 Tax=Pseudomonas syringae pv. persicae TaxID=237306 RepID=A0AB38EDA2_9PSED|nr:recombinase family protein [Pseudomonas syringae group genomosp. 3]SOQ09178.1 resolvase-like protein [Pseudomonas syringae pv. persicae]SOQ09235.1 resolvase-like protein [Pseudomonas syringae pv. persicae]